MDQTLVQVNTEYFSKLVVYNKIVTQRNALLKASKNSYLDINLLEVYNQKLQPLANYIHKTRTEFVKEILPFFEEAYEQISNKKEVFSIDYNSQLNFSSFNNLLKMNFEKDKILRRTTCGTHKDDLTFYMNDLKLKTFGSQGQQKTFLLALKLSLLNYLQKKLSKPVFFIIDDIFDKIDAERSKNLIKFVSNHEGQVFISYTNKNILEDKFMNIDYQLIEL